jgi:hypothetical protein
MSYGRIVFRGIVKIRYLILIYPLIFIGQLSCNEPKDQIPFDTHIAIGQSFIKPITHLSTDHSASYVEFQTHLSSIKQRSGFISIGGGYRHLLMPNWMSGWYVAFNHLLDSHLLGSTGTTLFNVGVESISPFLQVNFNGYTSLDAWLGQMPTKDCYLLSKVRHALDIKLSFTFLESITPFIGAYYMGIQADYSVLGGALGVRYQFDPHVSLEVKGMGSSEHNCISIGVKFETGKVEASNSCARYLWRPVERHLAPLVLWSSKKITDINNMAASNQNVPFTPNLSGSDLDGWGGHNSDTSVAPAGSVTSRDEGSSNIWSPPSNNDARQAGLGESQKTMKGDFWTTEEPKQPGSFEKLLEEWKKREAEREKRKSDNLKKRNKNKEAQSAHQPSVVSQSSSETENNKPTETNMPKEVYELPGQSASQSGASVDHITAINQLPLELPASNSSPTPCPAEQQSDELFLPEEEKGSQNKKVPPGIPSIDDIFSDS